MGVVGGVLSGNTFNTLSIGGVDRNGQSAANRLEYLILEAGANNAMPQSTLALLYNERLPDDFPHAGHGSHQDRLRIPGLHE